MNTPLTRSIFFLFLAGMNILSIIMNYSNPDAFNTWMINAAVATGCSWMSISNFIEYLINE